MPVDFSLAIVIGLVHFILKTGPKGPVPGLQAPAAPATAVFLDSRRAARIARLPVPTMFHFHLLGFLPPEAGAGN